MIEGGAEAGATDGLRGAKLRSKVDEEEGFGSCTDEGETIETAGGTRVKPGVDLCGAEEEGEEEEEEGGVAIKSRSSKAGGFKDSSSSKVGGDDPTSAKSSVKSKDGALNCS